MDIRTVVVPLGGACTREETLARKREKDEVEKELRKCYRRRMFAGYEKLENMKYKR